jgi:glucose-6-phosphate isomerase
MEIKTQGTKNISEAMVLAHLKMLTIYKKTLESAVADDTYGTHETSLRTPFDTKLVEKIKKTCADFRRNTKTVLLVGIGGSNLGTCAVYDALRGYLRNSIETDAPKLISFATVEPNTLVQAHTIFETFSKPEDVTLIVISKSGTTLETTANANILFSEFEKKFGKKEACAQTIIIGDSDTELALQAEKEGVTFFSLPKMIGGRFSVFTAVGLVPLHILGFDIDALTEGAQKGSASSATAGKSSSAAVIASFLFEAYLQGARVHEMFIWHPELETLGKWYKQLLAESIGKEYEDGTSVGYSPTIAIGSTDLHSVGQLIFGGRNDRFTTFVSAPSIGKNAHQTFTPNSLFTLLALEGNDVGEVFTALFRGVQAAYENNDLAFISIELSEINERELGAFMTLHMATIMYLAKLFDINAFDQPSVETYKNEVREKLTKNN